MKLPYHRVLLVFLDGVGLAAAGPHNPFSELDTPILRGLLGGPLTSESRHRREGVLLRALDARLGVEGLPQSATGQAALFTGVNAARWIGRHVTGLPGPRLRALVEEKNLFRQAGEHGLIATFANAYTPDYLEALRAGDRRPSVTTCALRSSGLQPRLPQDLERGEAVSWDIERDRFRQRVQDPLAPVEAELAGRQLGDLARRHDLTVFESFLTDLAGHRRLGVTAAEAVRRVDALLGGLLAARGPETTVLVTSDHGNLEDGSHRRHTLNPVPLLVIGPLAERFAAARSILDVTPAILGALAEPA